MREPVVLDFCDVEWVDSEERVPAEAGTFEFLVDGKVVEVQLCAEHVGVTLSELSGFLATYGHGQATGPKRVKATSQPMRLSADGVVQFACPHCTKGPFKTEAGLGRHLSTRHPDQFVPKSKRPK
jgi:hypothetical protein